MDALEDPWVGRRGWAELAWVPGPPQAEDRIPQILPKMHTARPPTCQACGSVEADPSGIDGLEHLRVGAGEQQALPQREEEGDRWTGSHPPGQGSGLGT